MSELRPAQPAREQALEELVFVCLERIEREGDEALQAVCAEHPELADELRARVRALFDAGLLASSHAQGFPERLGEFELLERLGAGGMGVVYRARQGTLGREVALKLVRHEQIFFPGARERFRREVATVAAMAHPGIVQIHVVGEERGIPYFAMELIGGASLAEAIAHFQGRDPATLTGADLRALLVQRSRARGEAETTCPDDVLFGGNWRETCVRIAREVAQALEHAHQRGVVHRDVKPSNVMLTPQGRVLLLDFGLASARGSTRITRTGSQTGSLAYMAPEQLLGEEADARTDVYSLGATMYEALALRLPYEADNTLALQQRILAGHPRPLAGLHRGLSRDLDAVVAVALSPERARRFPTAADLARDLTHVIEHRPIEARAAGPWVALARWAARRPAAAAAAGLGLLIAVGGPLAFGAQKMRAARSERLLSDQLGEQGLQAEAERVRAEDNLDRALEAVQEMLVRVGNEELSDVSELEGVRSQLLNDAGLFFERLLAQREGDSELLGARVRTVRALADVLRMLGRGPEAEQRLAAQIDAARRLAEREDASVRDLQTLADALSTLSILIHDRGDAPASLELLREGLFNQERAAELAPDDGEALAELATLRANLAFALSVRGDHMGAAQEAERALESAEELCRRHPSDPRFLSVRSRIVADSAGYQAALLDFPGAERLFLRALSELDALLATGQADDSARRFAAQTRASLAEALGRMGRSAEAVPHLERALEIAQGLVDDFPSATAFADTLAGVEIDLGTHLGRSGRMDLALEHFESCIASYERLLANAPDSPGYRQRLGIALAGLGSVLLELGRTAEAGAPLERGLALLEELRAADRSDSRVAYQLGAARVSQAELVIRQGGAGQARTLLEPCLELLQGDPQACLALARSWMDLFALTEVQGGDIELGDRCAAAALEALAHACRLGACAQADLERDPLWEPLRGLPEFDDMVRAAAEPAR